MKNVSDITSQRCVSASRKIFWLGSCVPFLLVAILAQMAPSHPEPGLGLLLENVIRRILFLSAFLSIIITLMTPGFLFVLLLPELGQAWLRGINPIWHNRSWVQLSGFAKFWTFLEAMISFGFGILIVYQVIIGN